MPSTRADGIVYPSARISRRFQRLGRIDATRASQGNRRTWSRSMNGLHARSPIRAGVSGFRPA
jgi:hypothetical protein